MSTPISTASRIQRFENMNKTEERFRNDRLWLWKQNGWLGWYAYEPMRFRLARQTYYTPDFVVLTPGGQMIAYDVKMYWRKSGKAGITDDAAVKIKLAEQLFPFIRWRYAIAKKGAWKIRTTTHSKSGLLEFEKDGYTTRL